MARQSRLEVALFGKSGEEIRPALEQWSQGTDDLIKKLSDLGLMLDPGVAESAERSRQALAQAGDTLETAVTPAFVDLSHALVGLAYGFGLVDEKALQAVRDAGEFKGMVETSADALKAIAAAHQNIVDKAVLAADAEDRYGIQIGLVKQHIADLNAGLAELAHQPGTADQAALMTKFRDGIKEADVELKKLLHEQAGPAAKNTSGFGNLGQKAIEDARQTMAEIDAMETEDNIERLARDHAVLAQLLSDRRLNAKQREDVERQLTQNEGALERAEANQARSIANEQLQEIIQAYQERLHQAIQSINEEYSAHRISAQQRHDLEVALTLQIEAEVLKRFDAEHAGLVKGTADWATAMKQRLALVKGFDSQVNAANQQLLTEEQQKWTQFSSSIASSFGGAIKGMLNGSQTFNQGMLNILSGIENSFIDLAAKMLETWIETEIEQLIFGKSTSQEIAQSGISAAAALAGANAVASWAAAPWPIDAGAPAFGAGMAAAAGSYSALAAFETGAWNIPSTGPALLHKGEMVVPQTFAQSFRENGGGGMGGSHVHMHVNVNAMDGPSVAQFFEKNMHMLSKKLANHMRANPGSRPNY